VVLWRISNHSDLTGLGGEKADGRWHTGARGKRIVYLSEHPAVALVEALAALKGNPDFFPTKYQLLKIRVADGIIAARLAVVLGDDWRVNPTDTRAAGDDWLRRLGSALLVVPSAPSPESLNYLFNPLHRDASRVTIEWSKSLEYDRRLFKARDSAA
jgi:RES domain-containing protein